MIGSYHSPEGVIITCNISGDFGEMPTFGCAHTPTPPTLATSHTWSGKCQSFQKAGPSIANRVLKNRDFSWLTSWYPLKRCVQTYATYPSGCVRRDAPPRKPPQRPNVVSGSPRLGRGLPPNHPSRGYTQRFGLSWRRKQNTEWLK